MLNFAFFLQNSPWKDRHHEHTAPVPIFGWIFHIGIGAATHTRIAGLGDELSLAVDAGVRTLAGDPLLPVGHVAGRRRAAARVLGTWDGTGGADKQNPKHTQTP